jgi:hypothetical protein
MQTEEMRVTEAEWLAATDPRPMLEFIGSRASDRKLRLLACACCRRVWHLANAPGRVAVETAERFADGQATGEELEVARRKATIDDRAELNRLRGTPADAHENFPDWDREESPASVAHMLVRDAADFTASRPTFSHLGQVVLYDGHRAPARIADAVAVLRTNSRDESLAQADHDTTWASGVVGLGALSAEERLAQVKLLHDIFGNPFGSVLLDPDWLTSTVMALARQMYDTHDSSAMPLLADALEDAGCTDAELLGHLRSPGPHVRGCWAVDLVLGKS